MVEKGVKAGREDTKDVHWERDEGREEEPRKRKSEEIGEESKVGKKYEMK